MSTTRTFASMLNQYLTYDLLKEEMVKRDYILRQVTKDKAWKGGELIVPFKGSQASSVKAGALTAATDISQDEYVRGKIDNYKEIWGTMLFNSRDLQEHNGMIPEKSFLKVLPDAIDDFMDNLKQVVSVQLGTGPHFATATADGANTGKIKADRIDRFHLGQKIIVNDNQAGNTASTGYVKSINVNTNEIEVVTTRGGSTADDLAAFTTANKTKFYHDAKTAGGTTDYMTSLRSQLLSSANGGSSKLFGQTKTDYPFLQCVNVSGSSITATNIVKSIFEAHRDIKIKGRGTASEAIMSFKNFAACQNVIETSKGAFNVVPNSAKASQYGFMELMIGSVSGHMIKLVGIQEMDDDIIPFMDWRCVKFHSNGMFRRERSPDGNEFFTNRAETGYQYILDIALFGELAVNKPTGCGIIHGIDY